jgi:uncharacterized protein (TIGR00730 family)
VKYLCVYCGSSVGGPIHREAARELARGLVSRGWGVVYGGASVGLMGIVADEVLAAGGSVVGVIPRSLQDREIAHRGLSRLHVTGDMHERKALMVSLSDAFVALPGGWGTLDELCEVITWRQLSLHHKPCGILNTDGFFDAFLLHLDRMEADGFSRFPYRSELVVTDSPRELLRQLTQPG